MSTGDSGKADDEGRGDGAGPGSALLGIVLLLALCVVAYKIEQAVDPQHIVPKKDAGPIDLVLGDRTTLIFVRFGVIAASVYVFYSIGVLAVQQRPLSNFAGMAADPRDQIVKAARDSTEQQERLEQSLQEAAQEIRDKDDFIEELIQEREALVQELQRRPGG